MLDIYNKENFAAFLGYFSIVCWIVVFTPQIRENYIRKNTDGISVSFLTFWILGDITNLFGVILDNLLFTMLLLALYYLLADCVLMGQVLYYRSFYKPNRDEVVVFVDPEARHPLSTTQSFNSDSSPSEHSSLLSHVKSNYSSTTVISLTSSRTKKTIRVFFILSILMWVGLLFGSAYYFFWSGHKIDVEQLHLVPQIMGWLSAILYCTSRIPQIMQNFRNESVDGLSLTMFVFSVVGNITYCLSILFVSLDPTFLLINYPWLLGSGGTLFFDFTIFFQFYMYRNQKTVITE
ncbi:PQ-loop-domain-containing protein [Backusella circina FSU 941]|nr:PQ-loop-domain-containing protein [Backusella circina FSU 941]